MVAEEMGRSDELVVVHPPREGTVSTVAVFAFMKEFFTGCGLDFPMTIMGADTPLVTMGFECSHAVAELEATESERFRAVAKLEVMELGRFHVVLDVEVMDDEVSIGI